MVFESYNGGKKFGGSKGATARELMPLGLIESVDVDVETAEKRAREKHFSIAFLLALDRNWFSHLLTDLKHSYAKRKYK